MFSLILKNGCCGESARLGIQGPGQQSYPVTNSHCELGRPSFLCLFPHLYNEGGDGKNGETPSNQSFG